MIKFFRKIRQKLLSENKFSKYLIYALGEIILVVIGILIALQISNWNERKKSTSQLRSQLIAIQNDINSDLTLFDQRKEVLKSAAASGDRLWGLINSVKPVEDNIQSKIDFLEAGNFPEYQIVTTAYDDLISTGFSSLIHNKALKTSLANYYSQELIQGHNLEQRIRYTNDYFDARYRHMNPYMLTNHLKHRFKTDTLNITPLDSYPLNWDAIKKDETYRMALSKVISQRTGDEFILYNIIQQGKALHQEIEAYLLEIEQ